MADETRADKWRLIRGTNLKPEDRSVLLTLFFFQGDNSAAFCKQETLADEIGVSARSIRKSLKRLNDAGIVVSEWKILNSVPMRVYAIKFDVLKTVQRVDGRNCSSDPETVDGRNCSSAPVGTVVPDHQEPQFLQERSIEHPKKIQRGASLPDSSSPKKKTQKRKTQNAGALTLPNLPEKLDSDAFRKAWSEWVTYRREIKKSLTPSTTSKQLANLATWGSEKAIQSIENSISNGWQGLFDPDGKQGSKVSQSSDEDDWLSVLIAINKYPTGSNEDIAGRRALLRPELYEAMKEIRSSRISASNDFERNQTLKPIFFRYLREIRNRQGKSDDRVRTDGEH